MLRQPGYYMEDATGIFFLLGHRGKEEDLFFFYRMS
jgi:hypothetical protein